MCDSSARWFEYVDSLPWKRKTGPNTKGTLNNSSYLAFLRAVTLQINSQTAIDEVAERIRRAGATPPMEKLQQQLVAAYAYVSGNPGEFTPGEKLPKPVYDPEKLASVAAKLEAENIDEDFFIARSPVTTWNRSAAGFLHKLFREGEHVVVFDIFRSQGCTLWTCPGLTGNFSVLDYLTTDRQNVWFLCNPVDGHWREIERLRSEHNPTGRTRRSEECVSRFRYAVIESDEAPRDLWLKALARLPLPIASIVDSGGSSIHALFRVDAESKSQWDDLVGGRFEPALTTLGADPQAMTAVRLTRLANCFRGEKANLQRLLYLNDSPDNAPICDQPILREC